MPKKKQQSAPYYNIGQLRVSYWNNLKNETAELARCNRGSANEKKRIVAAAEILKELAGVERFFAFPGLKRVESLKTALERKEHTSLAHNVAETTRHLVSDSYRSNPNFLDDESEQSMEQVEIREAVDGVRRNYFEVLFVETCPMRMKRPCDKSSQKFVAHKISLLMV